VSLTATLLLLATAGIALARVGESAYAITALPLVDRFCSS
jgi:hypothetical protein